MSDNVTEEQIRDILDNTQPIEELVYDTIDFDSNKNITDTIVDDIINLARTDDGYVRGFKVKYNIKVHFDGINEKDLYTNNLNEGLNKNIKNYDDLFI